MAEQQMQPGSVPSPDPTVLTTDALRREIGALKELLMAQVEASGDKAKERSREIEDRLTREEKHRLENKVETQRAVDAALDSQRKAADKVEMALDKQLAEIKANINTTIEGLRRELADLKDRVARSEFGPPPGGTNG